MSLSNLELPAFLKSGNKAHLIPVVKDSNKEVRATSSVLAVMLAVPDFGKAILDYIGAPITKRSRLKCFTEVVFKDSASNDKPDGLIIVESGASSWSAIIEAKVGNNKLDQEQIERYLDIAKANNIDALVTISNQLAVLPTFHPVEISKQKTRNVGLYHVSWKCITTEALRLINSNPKLVVDPAQEFVLAELIWYLENDRDVYVPFNRMPASWKDICMSFQQSLPVSRSPQTREIVESWHQLARYLALKMSIAVNTPVTVNLTKAQKADKETFINDCLSNLVENGKLKAEFVIPDAASRIRFKADLKTRTLSASMKIEAPGDRVQAKSSINWLFKQIDKCEDKDNDISIIAFWPGKVPQTHATLGELREDRKVLLSGLTSQPPTAFTVRRIVDLAGKFSGVSILVEKADNLLPDFYEDIGQHLQAWKPSPPQVVASAEELIDNTPKKEKEAEHGVTLPSVIISPPDAPVISNQILQNNANAISDNISLNTSKNESEGSPDQ